MTHEDAIARDTPTIGPADRSLVGRLFASVDIAPLVFFRIVFGTIMLWECWRYVSNGWIDRYWIDKPFHFTYYGFGWVRPWPGDGMYWHFAVMAVLATCIALGLFYRVAATLFFFAISYVFLLDQANYLNHIYMVCLVSFLMIFVPAHRSFSVDAARRPSLRTDIAPAWTLWAIRGQLAIVYFFGGVAKINGDWLRGEPMRMWLADRTDFPIVGRFFESEWMVYSMSYSGMLLDLLIVPFLLWRRTRFLAVAAVTLFHLMNSELFSIGIFPWFMMFATLVFLPPHWFRVRWPAYESHRRARDAARGVTSPGARPARIEEGRLRRVIVVGLAAYMGVQIALPLRHWLYPGNVNWTEEGHLFSWHMKLRTKSATARFFVTDPASGDATEVRPRDYLTSRQAAKMEARPDMVLQFAHFLAERARADGIEKPEVRVRSRARLNGRGYQDMIDRDVDLAAEPRSLTRKRWIVPLEARE